MLVLGMKSADPIFKELKKEDCTLTKYKLNMSPKQRSSKPLKTQHSVSWIWRMGSEGAIDDDMEWFSEGIILFLLCKHVLMNIETVQKTQWFLCRAQKERWSEEVEIVEEEMCRVLRFFKFFDQLWLKVAKQYKDNHSTQSYAIQMAMMYRGLFKDAKAQFDPEVVKSIECFSI